jgi:hypothetical protein
MASFSGVGSVSTASTPDAAHASKSEAQFQSTPSR